MKWWFLNFITRICTDFISMSIFGIKSIKVYLHNKYDAFDVIAVSREQTSTDNITHRTCKASASRKVLKTSCRRIFRGR